MNLILSSILKPYYVPFEWVKVNYEILSMNPSLKLTKFMINNYDKLHIHKEINEGLILYKLRDLKVIMGGKLLKNTTNPDLASYVIHDYVLDSQLKSRNEKVIRHNIANRIYIVDAAIDDNWKWQLIPSPQLTQVIINSRHHNWHYIASNSNPELTDFILKNISVIEENEYLTEKITKVSDSDNEDDVNYFGKPGGFLTNTNPAFAKLIMGYQVARKYWHYVSTNSNEGLTDFIIQNKKFIQPSIVSNTNKKLLSLIYEMKDTIDHDELTANPIIAKLKPIKLYHN
jgi:hypothetical protein